MSFEVDPDWWKDLFDEVYLTTDARSVCDDEVTRKEIDLLQELIPLSPDQEILDLCGGHGRHSRELALRGFGKCTVFDFSQFLIDRGREAANEAGVAIRFLQGDARKTGLPQERFDHVLVLGNSLGYIASPDGDRDILSEAMRLMKSGGRLLLDIVNGGVLKSGFQPAAWHEIGEEIVVCRRRSLEGDIVYTRELVVSKKSGLVKDRTYLLRIYDPDSMRLLLSKLGFSGINVIRDFSPFRKTGDFGFMNFRMIVTATKP
ncbi:MAG TPA: class I SAM-dependent methyltransferase [Candidatus Bathyarchaeia archaeon]|nr:class I SAM-dependent methyltransferase [Candidatus Bathyarchaeia archaeon]